MRTAGRHDDDRVTIRTAATSIALASVTALLSVGASNPGMWDFTPYLLVPSLLAFLTGLVTVVFVKRLGGNVEAGTIAALVATLLLVGGGTLVRPLGAWGVGAVAGIAITTYWLARRLLRAFDLRRLLRWVALALVLINGAYAIQIGIGFVRSPESRQLTVETSRGRVESPDVAVLILDEFASLHTAPLRPGDEERLISLEQSGYEVREAIWSSYPVSAASIAAILDGSYPITEGAVLDNATLSRLGVITGGKSRLVESLKSEGYRFTMVDSGLWMTTCGPDADECVENQPLDEMLGILLEKSAVGWWYRRIWGDAFIVSGLHSMKATRSVLLGNADDGQRDLIVAHIMLPHLPYILDEDCERHHREYASTREERLKGYQLQAGCVADWLEETLIQLDRASSTPPAVVVVGDHGTNFSGQLSQPLEAWTEADVLERLASFAAFRLPEGCSSGEIEVTPQLVDNLVACLGGTDPSLRRQHFLTSYGDETPHVVEYPPHRLDDLVPDGWVERQRKPSNP